MLDGVYTLMSWLNIGKPYLIGTIMNFSRWRSRKSGSTIVPILQYKVILIINNC